MTNGSAKASIIFSATISAVSASSVPGSRMANSSPPKRAAVSDSRKQACNLSAASFSRQSPAAWPRLSLTSLKRSRSMNCTTALSPTRRDRFRACDRRSKKSVRLGRSVSASKLASRWISADFSDCLRRLSCSLRVWSTMASRRAGSSGSTKLLTPDLSREAAFSTSGLIASEITISGLSRPLSLIRPRASATVN